MILAANVMSRSQNEGFKVTEKRAARWLSIYSCGQFPTPLPELSGVSVVTRGSHVTTCPVHSGKPTGYRQLEDTTTSMFVKHSWSIQVALSKVNI